MSTLPDSGSRSVFATGAQRDAMEGKGLPHHLPTRALRRAARRFEDGAIKYSDHNWRKGIPLGRYVDSLLRHLWSYIDGDVSEDHLGAMIWNAMCLSETDDMIRAGELAPDLDNLSALRFQARNVTAEPGTTCHTVSEGQMPDPAPAAPPEPPQTPPRAIVCPGMPDDFAEFLYKHGVLDEFIRKFHPEEFGYDRNTYWTHCPRELWVTCGFEWPREDTDKWVGIDNAWVGGCDE